MANEYLLYSGVSIGNAPIVLSAGSLDPPDQPTSGLLVTAADTGGWTNLFTLQPDPMAQNYYAMVHTSSGLYVRYMGENQQLVLTGFAPFDATYYFQLGGSGPNNVTVSPAAEPTLVFTVPGSNFQPGSPVVTSQPPGGRVGGQVWQLLGEDKHGT